MKYQNSFFFNQCNTFTAETVSVLHSIHGYRDTGPLYKDIAYLLYLSLGSRPMQEFLTHTETSVALGEVPPFYPVYGAYGRRSTNCSLSYRCLPWHVGCLVKKQSLPLLHGKCLCLKAAPESWIKFHMFIIL